MAHFTQTFTQNGPIVDVWIGMSYARIEAFTTANRTLPKPKLLRGLIDTGASHTCIDPMAFSALDLQPRGTVRMHTPSTGDKIATAFTYDVSLIIPHAGSTGITDGLTFPNLRVSACELFATQTFHVLIGRDVLSQCVLLYNGGTGNITLAY